LYILAYCVIIFRLFCSIHDGWRNIKKKEEIGEFVLPYLNPLSDLLFVLDRVENEKHSVAEEKWEGQGKLELIYRYYHFFEMTCVHRF